MLAEETEGKELRLWGEMRGGTGMWSEEAEGT